MIRAIYLHLQGRISQYDKLPQYPFLLVKNLKTTTAKTHGKNGRLKEHFPMQTTNLTAHLLSAMSASNSNTVNTRL